MNHSPSFCRKCIFTNSPIGEISAPDAARCADGKSVGQGIVIDIKLDVKADVAGHRRAVGILPVRFVGRRYFDTDRFRGELGLAALERCEAVKVFFVGVCIVGKLDIGKVCKAGLAGEVIKINELTVGCVVGSRRGLNGNRVKRLSGNVRLCGTFTGYPYFAAVRPVENRLSGNFRRKRVGIVIDLYKHAVASGGVGGEPKLIVRQEVNTDGACISTGFVS